MRHIAFFMLITLLFLFSISAADPIDTDKRISMHLEEVPITTVLNMLAQQYNLNIVQSAQIEGELSLRLDDVKLKDALNAILAPNGYNYYLSGNIVVVKPLELNAIGETVSRAVTLDYISPAAAVNAAQGILSDKGSITIVKDATGQKQTFGRAVADRVVIVELPELIESIVNFLHEIDQPEPMIAIEVRMIESNFDLQQKTGFKWPTSLEARAHGIVTSSSTTGTTDYGDQESMGQIDLPYGKWEWGKLSVNELKLVLDFLEEEGNSKLISDPRITTLNNHRAEIKVTTIVPVQTLNRFSEGASVQDIVTFQDIEVGITLLVTPHITKDGKILLDVQPTVAEIIGFSGPPDQQKPITSERSIKTKIIVADGETAVLGGLLKENKIENEYKVFFLGSLPIIGGLFKHKTVQSNTTDLTILITPRIIKD